MSTPIAVTPEQILGQASRLVATDHSAAVDYADMGSLFQWVVMAVGIGYIIASMLNSEAILYLLRTTVQHRSKRTSPGNLLGEVRNLEASMSIIGLIALSLFIVRYSASAVGAPLLYDYGLSAWGAGVVSLIGIGGIWGAELGALKLVGIVCEQRKMCTSLIHFKLMHFALMMVILLPLVILSMITTHGVATTALWVIAVICILGIVIFIKETFILFQAQRISIFHWFLYLCTLELMPLSLIIAPIVRHS